VVDDATKRLLYAELTDQGEGTVVVMRALRTVFRTHGLPIALYTDRAGWAVHTPTSGSAPDRTRRTQVGRALDRLGIEHILGYSPQARGRSERANRTLQDRLVNELRLAGITTVAAANRYLRERFLPAYNAEFARARRADAGLGPPARRRPRADPLSRGRAGCRPRQHGAARQRPAPGRQAARPPACDGLRVAVRRHLDGWHSVWHVTRCPACTTTTGA
jgi:hypothetical protein